MPGREGRPRRQSRGRQTRVAPRPRGERNCSRAPRPSAAPPPLPRSAPRPATGTPRSHSRAARCCPNRPCSPRRRARRRRLSRRCSRRRGRPNHRRRAVSKTPFTASCAAVKAATCAFEFGAAGMISGPGSCVIARAKCEGAGLRSRAVPAEHRVSRQAARAADTAEYSRIPLPSSNLSATSRPSRGYLRAISGYHLGAKLPPSRQSCSRRHRPPRGQPRRL